MKSEIIKNWNYFLLYKCLDFSFFFYRCKTDFCYLCGGKHYSLGWFGNHYSQYSFLGCKYNLHPHRPVLRIAIRSGVIIGGTLAMPLALTGVLIGATLVLPSVLIYKKCKRLWLFVKCSPNLMPENFVKDFFNLFADLMLIFFEIWDLK